MVTPTIQDASSSPRQGRRMLMAAMVMAALTVLVVWGALSVFGKTDKQIVVTSADTVVVEVPPVQAPAMPVTSLAVFRTQPKAGDELPVQFLGSLPPAAIDSRLLIGGPGKEHSLYAWWPRRNFLCQAVTHSEGLDNRCSDFRLKKSVGPFFTTRVSGRTLVGGIVANGVTSVLVKPAGRRCAAKVRRNGFLCSFRGTVAVSADDITAQR